MTAKVYKPPQIGDTDGRPSVFLAGSIEMGAAADWQSAATTALGDLPINIYNPRRDDWDSSWEQEMDNPPFREQVEWEIDHLIRADVRLFYFDPTTKAPVTMMELGLVANRRNVVVACPPGFWRRGNVQIVCDRYAIPCYDTLVEAVGAVREKLT